MHTKLPAVQLSENQVDIWCARLPDEGDFGLFHSYRGILTPEETERYGRFAFEKDRRQFLLTRALERDVLSRYLGVEPAALVFTRNEYGKPAIAEPVTCSIAFSLSHTKGLSVCAVVSAEIVGVDVESLQRSPGHRDIAKRFFANSEAAYLESLDEGKKRTEFLRLWTLKEAFIKARGLGLFLPLNSFVIETLPGRSPCVSFSEGIHAKQTDWQFLQIRLGGSFHIAIALLRPGPKATTVRFSTITPMTGVSTSVSLKPNHLNEWALGEV